MRGVLVAVLIVVVVLARLGARSRHRRRNRDRDRATSPRWWGSSAVAMVAEREIRERVRSRLFRVGTAVILLVVSAAIVIPVLTKSKPTPERVGVVGALAVGTRAAIAKDAVEVGTTVRFVQEANAAAAKRALRHNTIDLAVLDVSHLETNDALSSQSTSTLAQFVSLVASDLGVANAVARADLSAQQASILAHASPVAVASLHPAKGGRGHVVNPTALIGDILIFTMLSQYNTWTLIGVMEEKSSRVIEVLLAAVRPLQLLGGKVLGIGAVAIAQAATIVTFALVLARLVGSTVIHGTSPWVIVSTLVWLLVGYGFYCWVYAAAGSMAERQDQVQSLAFPLSLPMVFGYVLSLLGASSGSPTLLLKVLAYVPPTAPFAMPVLVGLKSVTWWQFLLSVALSLLSTLYVARFASTIYRRSILRTRGRIRWRDVLGTNAG